MKGEDKTLSKRMKGYKGLSKYIATWFH